MSTRAVSTRRSSPPPRGAGQVAGGSAGSPSVLRAGSAGFTVFVLGMLATPVVGMFVPAIASAWPWAVSVGAFALAGLRARPVGPAHRAGAAAALVTLALGLPLLLLFPIVPVRWTDLIGLAVSAVLVGAISGVVARKTSTTGSNS